MTLKIFATVGSTYPLDRLILQLDELGKNKKYEIFAQTGDSKLKPKNINWEKILEYGEIKKKIKWADIVIAHAGIGTIIDCLNQNKQLILFPRLKTYSEAIDDHQLEICKAFQKKYSIKFTKNIKKIDFAIAKKKRIKKNLKNMLYNEIEAIIS